MMTTTTKKQRGLILQALYKCGFFSAFDEGQMQFFLDYGRFVRCEADTCLLRENQFDSNFYVVINGQVSVIAGQRTLTSLGPGDFFGEMGTVAGQAADTSIVARKNSLILKLEATVTEAGDCEFQRRLYRTICERMIARLARSSRREAAVASTPSGVSPPAP